MKPNRISARKRRSFGESRPIMPKSTATSIAPQFDEQVARVHVGMKEAVAYGMPKKRSG